MGEEEKIKRETPLPKGIGQQKKRRKRRAKLFPSDKGKLEGKVYDDYLVSNGNEKIFKSGLRSGKDSLQEEIMIANLSPLSVKIIFVKTESESENITLLSPSRENNCTSVKSVSAKGKT